jgi:hypothetical protein
VKRVGEPTTDYGTRRVWAIEESVARKLHPERRARIIALAESGANLGQLARQFSLSRHQIKYIIALPAIEAEREERSSHEDNRVALARKINRLVHPDKRTD